MEYQNEKCGDEEDININLDYKQERLQLDGDIYSISFYAFLKDDNPIIHKELMMKSLITFVF